MKERITFVHAAEGSFDPSQLRVENNSLSIKSLKAAREDRITFSLQELPQELYRVLNQCHELHLRWSSLSPYSSISPFVARTSPGLHIFYTPHRSRSADLLCPLARKVFGEGLKCVSPQDTFTRLPAISERFSSSSTYQYYQVLPSLDDLAIYIEQKICPPIGKACYEKASILKSADYLDIDFDIISQSLVLVIFRQESQNRGRWNEKINSLGPLAKIEVGVLANEQPQEPEELSLGGFLIDVGQDKKPSPTLFSFPSRHHGTSQSLESTYRFSFVSPTGLHPTMRLTFPSSQMTTPLETCALHSYLTLPSTLFPDKYQLSAPLFLSSKNLHSVRSVSGETDLEAPDWAIIKWGSAMLVELAPPPKTTVVGQSWHADIPLHLRYLNSSPSGVAYAEIPCPAVFWACTAEEGSKMGVNPFDRVNLGYDGLFGPRTIFYHLSPESGDMESYGANNSLMETLEIPVLVEKGEIWLESGTVLMVLLGFFWVIWKLVRAAIDVKVPVREAGSSKKSQ